MISVAIKSEEVSLREKVIVVVWPDFKAGVEKLMVIVGARVSTVIVN